MSDTVKQAGIKQSDGTYLMKDIGVDYSNVDGLDTAATAFKAKSADKATADKNNKDITEYIAGGSKSNGNLVLTKGDGTSSSIDLSMRGATSSANGETGFVPQPTSADSNKFLKGDGTWEYPKTKPIYEGSDNIEIDSSDLSIDLTDSTVVSGTYGPSADVVGAMGTTITVPRFTVDNKGRLTSAGQQTYTSVDTQYGVLNGLYQGGLGNTMFGLDAHSIDGPDYGPGTNFNYGHVKLSSEYKTIVTGSGIAASQLGLFEVYRGLYRKMGNDYIDITREFDDGTFSDNLSDYSPGNCIVKTVNGTTYTAVLADYNTFFHSYTTHGANVTQDHWVAMVFGFGVGPIDSSGTTAGGFLNSPMNTWLKGDCTTIVKEAFGANHLIAHDCFLTTGTYDSSLASHGFSPRAEEGHYTMLMTEAQLGYRAWSDLGYSTCEAYRPLKIFQNESPVKVFTRYFEAPDHAQGYIDVWLRDISSFDPSRNYCALNFYDGRATSHYAGGVCYRIPIILLN